MFSGEASARFTSPDDPDRAYDRVEDALSDLGDARVTKRGDLDIRPGGSLGGALTQTTLTGYVRRRKTGEYDISVSYSCAPTVLGWVLCVIFFPVGLLALLAPMNAKPDVARRVRHALDDLDE